MREKEWNKLTTEEKMEIGMKLFSSNRGAYLVSQALTLAIRALSKRPVIEREQSNIEDMMVLRDTLFPLYYQVERAQQAYITAKDAGLIPGDE